jgi:WD40 repeat protein
VRERIRRAFGRLVCLAGIASVATALVLIGCRAANRKAERADRASELAKPAVSDPGPLKRIGIPAAGQGYAQPLFSGNSRRFIAFKRESARVWDVSTLRPLCDPLPVASPAWGLNFDGKIAFTSDFQTVRFWNVDTSKLICATKVTDGKLRGAAISPDGGQFLTFAEGEDAVKVWRTGETRPRRIIKQGVLDAAFDPTGTRIVTRGGWDTRICSAETGKDLYPPVAYPSHILLEFATLFDPKGRWLLVYEYDGVAVVDLATGKTHFEVPLDRPWTGSAEEVKSAHWSADGRRIVLAYGFTPHPARIYDAATGKLERTVGSNVSHCWLGPRGRLAMGFRGPLQESFDVWDVMTGRTVQTLKVHSGDVSPDSSTMLEERDDGLGAIWQLR